MKLLFPRKTMLALAVAAVTAVGCAVQSEEPLPTPANEAALPPTASEASLPPGIAPDSQLAQVFKLVQAGLDAGVIKTFVENSTGAFELDADKIIALKDEGVPSDIINSMMDHDKKFYATAATPPPAPPASPTTVVETAPPVTPVTVTYFHNTLTPYGSWVEVDGYGRCWRPTVVIYDTNWRPYCDRGHWVYTDCGWYWDSEYSWGATFHYGRWFRHSQFGWCWYPDTEWGPSWVTFRSNNDYCGWAPLPPLAVYRPGAGFYYRGASVSIGFDFGLDAGCFTFVSPSRFCDRRPRYYSAGPQHVTQIFNQTTVINNYGNNNTTIVNNGISVQRISTETHRPIQPVTVAAVPNAARHGWRGDDSTRPGRGDSHDNNAGNDRNNSGRNLSNGSGQPGQAQNRAGDPRNAGGDNSTAQPPTTGAAGDRNANNGRNNGVRNSPATRGGVQPATGQTRVGDRRNAGGDNAASPPTATTAPGNRSANNDRNNQRDQGNRNANNDRNNQRDQGNINLKPQPQPKPVVGAPAVIQGQNVYRTEQRNNNGSGRIQQPPAVMPPANNVTPDYSQRQNNRQPTDNNRMQTENNSRNAREQTRQFNAPAAPVNSPPQNDWRPNRTMESPVTGAPVTRPAPLAEPRQSVQQREQQHEQQQEQRQRAVESAARAYTPPPAPAPAPAPAPSQSRSSERSSDRSSDRGSSHDADKDKK